MERKHASTVFLLILAVVSVFFCFLIARPFLGSIFLAVMIAIVCRPLNSFIKAHVHRPNAAALISTILVLVLLIAPAVGLVIAVRKEITGLNQSLEKDTAVQGGWNSLLAHAMEQLVKWSGNRIDLSVFDLRAELNGWMKDITRPLLSIGARALSNVFIFITNTVVTFFTLFYFFREGRSMREHLMAILPLNPNQTERLFTGIDNSIIANVDGCLAVAVSQGLLTGVAFLVLGLPLPVMWGIVTGLFSMIPVVGSGAVWGPAAIFLIVKGQLWKGVILLIWGAVVVAQVDSFVRPYIISKRAAMHPLAVFFALMGGVAVFGVMGLFVGPVILSVTIVVFQMLKESNLDLAAS